MNKTNNKMVISIITPCYNAAPYIATTIKSVQQQTFTGWEMIVVDDGSTDDSAEIVRQISQQDSRIKLVQKENGGSASARKIGLSLAKGEYIQFLDADDLLDKDKFQLQITLMEQHSLDVSYTDWCWINMNGETSSIIGLHCSLFRLLTVWGPFGTLPPHCFIYKHNFLKKNNINIPTHIKEREDWDFHIEVFSKKPNVQRISGYCGAYYMKAPTGKTTGASQATVSIGSFKYLLYRIGKESGYRQLLLLLRFSLELCYWWLRIPKTSPQHKLSSHFDFKSNQNRSAIIYGIMLLPVSLSILVAHSFIERTKTFIKNLW
jgi:glycosyltransferase involved in cell wall biosynthesis